MSNKPRLKKHTSTNAVGIILLLCAPFSAAQEFPGSAEIQKITSSWKCQWCPPAETKTFSGEVAAGAGYVSNDSFKQGDYTGTEEKGVYAALDANVNSIDENGTVVTLSGSDLGLDSREIHAQAGRQGVYNVELDYSELPKLTSDTARSPYQGNVTQRLPSTWQPGSTTQTMAQLGEALKDVELMTERKRYAVSGSYQHTNNLTHLLRFQRDTKQGRKALGVALGNSFATARSVLLAAPVDYVTNHGQYQLNYRQSRWQAALNYEFSNFDNQQQGIRWENAFSQPSQATEGLIASEPDNQMQQLSLAAGYQVNESMSANGYLAIGQLKQDDDFLPYTANENLSSAALPRQSLDGSINTFVANLTLNANVAKNLIVQVKYHQNEQDNDTARTSYSYVTADTAINSTARANFPYSFRTRRLQITGDYGFKYRHDLKLGYHHEIVNRTYQEVDDTTENRIWASYRNQVNDDFDLRVNLTRADRQGDSYEPQAEIIPAENTLLRKYNLADRTQDKIGLSLFYIANAKVHLNYFMDYALNDYSESVLGLQEGTEISHTFDVHYQPNEEVTLLFDYTFSKFESEQAGSQSFSVADWKAENDDSQSVAHLGVNYAVIKNKFSVGFDYTFSASKGKITVSGEEGFPDLTSTRHTFTLNSNYNLDKNAALQLVFKYEKYEEDNWAIDGVAPNSIANVLTLGERSPDYDIGILAIKYRYRFN